MSIGLTATMFGITVFLAVYAITAPLHAEPQDQHFEDPSAEDDTAGADPRRAGLFERLVRPALANFLPQTPLAASAKARNNPKVVELLVRSGNPWNIAPHEYTALRVLAALAGFFAFTVLALATILPAMLPVQGWMVAGAALGFFLPKVLLDSKKGARAKSASKGLPEALDLLVITLNAGQNFQPALAEVVTRLPEGIIKDELGRVSIDLRTGKTLVRSLEDFAKRAPSAEVESFCKAVIEAEQLGADVSETLTAQSRTARAAYEANMDKKSGALQTTLFFPIIALMTPALFIAILAPAISNIGIAF